MKNSPSLLLGRSCRVALGLGMSYEGYAKILNPMGMVGFTESLGFTPGWFWSPLLAVLQFFGGFLLALGLLTRPIALSLGIMMLVTVYYHISHPYPALFLTEAGVAALTSNPEFFQADAIRSLSDAGHRLLELAQEKAVTNSLFWGAHSALCSLWCRFDLD
ncbi:DoxX family protein [uncultured Cohaesibacter sp.]|uniref:DoxX family protein n=1 Tax=uncultured Cohaesibacter sp. TaxID=1002546 RepID=UPI0029C823B0|nr:DoxX family protein [uncultured Cohaesibacter sp.]